MPSLRSIATALLAAERAIFNPHSLTGEYYTPWEGIAAPRDLHIVSDIIVNVQTGTGNRIEFWDAHGTPPPSKGKIRRFIDVGRLTKGR